MLIGWTTIFAIFTAYLSTLSYALREASRVRVAELLDEDPERQRPWIEWLDRYDRDLKLVTAFGRFVSALAVLYCIALAWFADQPVAHAANQNVIAFDARLAAPNAGFTPWRLAQANLATLGLLLLCGIFVPNALTRYAGAPILARSLGLLYVLRIVALPLTAIGAGIDFVIMRLLGKSQTTVAQESERVEQEILDAVTEGEMQGAVDEDEKEMIASVFELRDTDVSAIMTPRTDVVAVDAESSFEEVRQILVAGGHSRLPVFQDSLDHIVGVLYAKDMLRLRPGDPFDARRVMRTVPYVPMSKKVSDLLRELKQNKVHIAIVLDEYGGTAGLVTIEDILEEIVGEIADEYDTSEPPAIRRIDEATLELNATVHVSEINAELGLELPESTDYETVGGFVFSTLGRIPVAGEQFTHDGVRFHVLDAEPRKINRLRISMIPAAAATS